MKKRTLVPIILAVVLCVAGLSSYCVAQSLRVRALEGQVKQLEPLTSSLESRVKTLNTRLEKLEPSKPSSSSSSAVSKASSAASTPQTSSSAPPVTTIAVQPQSETGSEKVAYLTFDDGPSQITPHLLDILKQLGVKATFFVVAQSEDTPQRRAWIKMESDGGNTVGVHSWSHNYSYIYKNEANFLTDFNLMKNMVVASTGKQPKFSRFPGGTDNTVSITVHGGTPIMPKLVSDVENMGFTPVDWNAGGMDAVTPVPSKEVIVRGVVDECRYLKKAVILLHDSAPHSSSVEAVPEIVSQLRAEGFVFKPLTEPSDAVTRKPALRH